MKTSFTILFIFAMFDGESILYKDTKYILFEDFYFDIDKKVVIHS